MADIPDPKTSTSPRISNRIFFTILFLLLSATLIRSIITTRLDSWTQDEDYHIAAGVSYIQRHDFRINPEHPPLIKLWVGAIVSATGFQLSTFREIHDKNDERFFVNQDMYLHNDFDSVQRRGRIAMWILNSLFLLGFILALRRVFGPIVALGVLLVLTLDPAVAAHFPLVLTDLPVSLLGATAVVLALHAFRYWTTPDLIACSVALGFTLGAKHSGPVFAILLFFAASVLLFVTPPAQPLDTRPRRLAKIAAVFLGACAILWSFYGFRFTESPAPQEVFNRTLAEKISDLRSPSSRFILSTLAKSHLLPRAYIWGLADTIRGGIEGRGETRLFYGHMYLANVPKYFFPGILAAKVPIGTLLLIISGLLLLFARRLPPDWNLPLTMLLCVILGFFAVLANGATYGGMRHALPVFVLLTIFAGFALHVAFTIRSHFYRATAALCLVAVAASALPLMRPYEYYNEFIGRQNAYRFFNDEGVDVEQRQKELVAYYHEHLQPTGEIPFLYYTVPPTAARARGFDWVGRVPERDAPRLANPVLTGTFFIGGWAFAKKPYWDPTALRETTPTARFGNLFVYKGSFSLPGLLANDRYFAAVDKLFAPTPDLPAAENLFRQSAQLDPNAYFVFIELGNLALARNSRDEALAAYQEALRHVPANHPDRPSIEAQIHQVSLLPPNQVPPLRDPMLE
jgi:hypothetical protein